jgi:hypothetical protein
MLPHAVGFFKKAPLVAEGMGVAGWAGLTFF